MRKNFFYRLNNVLILGILIFVGFLFFSKLNPAQSQTPTPTTNATDPALVSSVPAYIINSEIDVNLDPDTFTANFVSDGLTDKASDAQKNKFIGNGASVSLIDTPIKFTFDKKNSKLLNPGEVVYPAIPKGTAPINYRCIARGSPGWDSEENIRNCQFGVTLTSVFTDMQTSVITIGDKQFKVTPTEANVLEKFRAAVDEALNTAANAIITNSGLPDQTRKSVGTIRFWGDDQFQQFVPIDGANIKSVNASVDTTAVNKDEGLFATELSTIISSSNATAYKAVNVVTARLDEVSGPADIKEPFTPGKIDLTQASGLNNLKNAILLVVNQNNQKFTQAQSKLGTQVALRTISEADEYNVKYQLCDAFEQNPSKFSYAQTPYKNPIDRRPNIVLGVQIGHKCSYTDESGNTVDDSGCTMWQTYERVDPKRKNCISGISKHADDKTARNCALKLAGGDKDCDEFTVEESDLNLSQMEDTFPVGLGAYFQNATLNNLNPRDVQGPWLNYLSPYFCSKLNLSWDLKGGKDYIYHVGVETPDVSQGVIAFNDPLNGGKYTYIQTDVMNQYCVLGGLISNFAWAMTQQNNNFGTNTPATVINLPKEALTCDKKEVAIFGATPIKSNITAPGGQGYYILDDNVREDNKVRDNVAIYHGYNAYPLTDIVNDASFRNHKIAKYADYDMQVVTDPNTNKPKYAAISGMDEKGNVSLFLCKLPKLKTVSAATKPKSLCRFVDQGDFVFAEGVAMSTQTVRDPDGREFSVDTVTLVYRQPGGLKKGGFDPESRQGDEGNKAGLPYVYKYIDIIDQNDIQSSKLSTQFELPYKTGISAIQVAGGNLVVGGITLENDVLQRISAYSISPNLSSGVVKFDSTGENGSTRISEIIRIKDDTQISGNLCTDTLANYCAVLQAQGFVNSVKIAQDKSTKVIYLVAISAGYGVIFPIDPTGSSKSKLAYVFGYNKAYANIEDEYDAISAMDVNSAGDLDIFLERSGGYISVINPNSLSSRMSNPQAFNKELQSKCGTNCWVAVQKQFDPTFFTTDCSDYSGTGACGYPKLGKIGNPIVHSFIYGTSGKITAWYRQSGIDKTLLQSPDLLYSFTGLYKKIGEESSKEFSNAYFPQNGILNVKTEQGFIEANAIQGQPIRFYNYSSGGIQVGRELEDRSGKIRESDNLNPEKLDCLRIYSENVSGLDLYFGDTGLEGVGLNPAGSSSSRLTPVESSANTDSRSSTNSGEFCEESWCVPDEVAFISPMFKDDASDKPEAIALRQRIAAYLNRDISFVEKICKVASETGISCAILAATWKAESNSSTIEPRLKNANFPVDKEIPKPEDLTSPAQMGCFLFNSSICGKNGSERNTDYCKKWYTFDNQLRCTANSYGRHYRDYQPNMVLNGPRDQASSPGYDNTPNHGGGSCIPATRFSYVFQQYTPIDYRINNDNQCNTGLVVREGQDKYCIGGTTQYFKAAAINPATGKIGLPEIWAPATETRGNMQKSLIAMDSRLQAENNLCFPNKNGNTSSSNSDIQKSLNEYNLQGTTGIFKMNLKNWGNDSAAGDVLMVLKEGFNGAPGLEGAHVVKPGQIWSFNDTIGNPSDSQVVSKENEYANKKAPWESRNFDYSDQAVRRADSGWCELATTVRMAAEGAIGGDGKRLSATFKTREQLDGQATNTDCCGENKAYEGDINHWQHKGVTEESFNRQLAVGPYRLTDKTKFVSIINYAVPELQNDFNDGDLRLRNPYEKDTDMIITVEIPETGEEKGIITVKVHFGKKRTAQEISNNVCSPKTLVEMNVKGNPIQRDGSGKITAGAALVDVAADAYNKAREDVRTATGQDILDTTSEMLRAIGTKSNNPNVKDESWHKAGRAVDLYIERYQDRICGSNLSINKNSGCREAETVNGLKYWRIHQNNIDITQIMERNGFKRIPDRCASTSVKDKCEEWWHYEYNELSVSWTQAMLQLYSKAELRANFPQRDWDAVSCSNDPGSGNR